MSRARSAREDAYALAEPLLKAIREVLPRHLQTTDILRAALPYLTGAFVLLAGFAAAMQIGDWRDATLQSSKQTLQLYADLTAEKLKGETPTTDDAWQASLASALQTGATLNERRVLLADHSGKIRAEAPLGGGGDARRAGAVAHSHRRRRPANVARTCLGGGAAPAAAVRRGAPALGD